MGKRILISALLIMLAIVVVVAGATLLFQTNYQSLETQTQLQSSVAAAPSAAQPSAFGNLTSPQSVPEVAENSDGYEEVPADVPGDVPDITTEPVEADENIALAEAKVSEMTLEEKICQMLFVTPEALTGYSKVTQSGSATQSAYNEYPVGGLIYFADNLVTMDQTTQMISNVQDYARERSGFGLFIGVDEEGGSVARLADNLGTTEFEDMAVYGAEGNPDKAYEVGFTIAEDMRSLGFKVDFSPVADVLTNADNTVVKDRSFGSDPELVSNMVTQEVRGFVDGGVLCAPKHFPGHGSTGGDTHDGLAASSRTMEELRACDLLPFSAAKAAGAPMIMVGHMTMTEIDPDNPASLSSAIVNGILRAQMDYNGIIITDSLNMGAITELYDSGEASVKAIEAGCDMLLCVSSVSTAVNAVTDAVASGRITEQRINESVVRILAAKYQYGIAS